MPPRFLSGGEILLRQIRVEVCDCHHIDFSSNAKISRVASREQFDVLTTNSCGIASSARSNEIGWETRLARTGRPPEREIYGPMEVVLSSTPCCIQSFGQDKRRDASVYQGLLLIGKFFFLF